MIDSAVVLLAGVSTALLFGAAALHKLAAPVHFRAALKAYEILPARIVGIAGYSLPVCELLVVAGMCMASTRGLAFESAACLLGLYAIAIAINLKRGRRYIDCGCVGFGERRPIAAWLVVRNAALALILGSIGIVPWSARELSFTDATTVVGGLVVSAFLYLAVDELLTRLPHSMRAGA